MLNGQGKPVSAEVSITAADEGVLSLIAYKTPDPVATFYAPWALGVTSATQLEYIRDIPAPNIPRASGATSIGEAARYYSQGESHWVKAEKMNKSRRNGITSHARLNPRRTTIPAPERQPRDRDLCP